MEEEMAVKPQDFLVRRSGWMFFHIDAVRRWGVNIIDAMAERAGWPETRRNEYADEVDRLISDAVSS
ncbi:Aerobic glycerol-3-phosphate dehydrogenase [compost metagenome]